MIEVKSVGSFHPLGIFLILLVWSLLVIPPGWTQEIEVPANVQFALLQKMLAFDRNLKARAGEEIVIGILYQSNFRSSLNFKDELAAVVKKSEPDQLLNLPIRHVVIELVENLNLAEQAARHNLDIFYLAPVRAVDLKAITAVSHSRKILTFTGVPAYVEGGLTAGVGTKGDAPRIIINLPAAKAEGIEFNAQLLKLAKIVE